MYHLSRIRLNKYNRTGAIHAASGDRALSLAVARPSRQGVAVGAANVDVLVLRAPVARRLGHPGAVRRAWERRGKGEGVGG